MKRFLRAVAGATFGSILSFVAFMVVRTQGVRIIRESLADIYNALRGSAYASYEAKVKRRYDIHPSVYWGEDTLIYGDGNISIGEGSYVGRNSYLLAHPAGVTLRVGKYCSISHSVHIRTETNKKKRYYKDDLASPPLGADVTIGDYVWIGAHVFIGGGIRIGDNCIIGANSVVTHDVEADAIYAGVPARQVGTKRNYPLSDPAPQSIES